MAQSEVNCRFNVYPHIDFREDVKHLEAAEAINDPFCKKFETQASVCELKIKDGLKKYLYKVTTLNERIDRGDGEMEVLFVSMGIVSPIS